MDTYGQYWDSGDCSTWREVGDKDRREIVCNEVDSKWITEWDYSNASIPAFKLFESVILRFNYVLGTTVDATTVAKQIVIWSNFSRYTSVSSAYHLFVSSGVGALSITGSASVILTDHTSTSIILSNIVKVDASSVVTDSLLLNGGADVVLRSLTALAANLTDLVSLVGTSITASADLTIANCGSVKLSSCNGTFLNITDSNSVSIRESTFTDVNVSAIKSLALYDCVIGTLTINTDLAEIQNLRLEECTITTLVIVPPAADVVRSTFMLDVIRTTLASLSVTNTVLNITLSDVSELTMNMVNATVANSVVKTKVDQTVDGDVKPALLDSCLTATMSDVQVEAASNCTFEIKQCSSIILSKIEASVINVANVPILELKCDGNSRGIVQNSVGFVAALASGDLSELSRVLLTSPKAWIIMNDSLTAAEPLKGS